MVCTEPETSSSISQQRPTQGNNIEEIIELNFLLTYRTSPHSSTGEAPAILLMRRDLCTNMDLVKPDICLKVQKNYLNQDRSKAKTYTRKLTVRQTVLARSYRKIGEVGRRCHPRANRTSAV